MHVSAHIVDEISIHALRKESDSSPLQSQSFGLIFQSTLSVRRATEVRLHRLEVCEISIHALRKESDINDGK